MRDLQERAAHADPEVPLFTTPDATGAGTITLRDTTFPSPRPVVGRGITEMRRTIVKAVWPVLHDLVEQINAALLEFRYIEERLDSLDTDLADDRGARDSIDVITSEMEALRERLNRLESAAMEGRLARLEAASSPHVTPARVGDIPPIEASVAALASARARIDDHGDERLDAYRSVFAPGLPELELREDEADGDPLAPLAAASTGSLGGILALGLGDHLRADQWLSLARMAWGALASGGGIAIDMVNSTTPAGLALRSRHPALAPPVHPETVDFLFRAAGFEDVEIRYLGSFPDDDLLPIASDPDWFDARLNQMASLINRMVVGQPIVAVLARR